MELEFFSNLPQELMVDILSRLPVITIIRCKRVCKSWFSLITSHEFVTSHHSRSIPQLAAFSICHQMFRLDDGLDLTFKYFCPNDLRVGSSINGLLFVRDTTNKSARVLNPITREYIPFYDMLHFRVTYWGFGVSKITGSYNVVKVYHARIYNGGRVDRLGCNYCYVYTLGIGTWRDIKPDAWACHSYNDEGAFVNGNLHWLVVAKDRTLWISCLDLETESFTAFSPPVLLLTRRGYIETRRAEVLMDCLCVSDSTVDEFVIWLMKEYGVETSWTKQFVIKKDYDFMGPLLSCSDFYSIGASEDGDVLMFCIKTKIFYYSKKKNTVQRCESPRWDYVEDPILYKPSFLSLRRFAKETVCKTSIECLYYDRCDIN